MSDQYNDREIRLEWSKEIVIQPGSDEPAPQIHVVEPALEPVKCTACEIQIPQAMAYRVVRQTEVYPACSPDHAERIRQALIDGVDVAMLPLMLMTSSDSAIGADQMMLVEFAIPPEQPEEEPKPEREAVEVSGPDALIAVGLSELRPLAEAGNEVAQHWLDIIEHTPDTNGKMFVLGTMRLRLMTDARADARVVYGALFDE